MDKQITVLNDLAASRLADGAPLTSSPTVLALVQGSRWSANALTYSFLTSSSTFDPAYPVASLITSVIGFSGPQKSAFQNAMARVQAATAQQFQFIEESNPSVADLRVGFSMSYDFAGSGQFSLAMALDNPASAGDIWMDPLAKDVEAGRYTGNTLSSAFAPGSYAHFAMVHELGHALGLKHPSEPVNTNPATSNLHDAQNWSVMSYGTSREYADAVGYSFYPTTFMRDDIAALQTLYGAAPASDEIVHFEFNDAAGATYFETLSSSSRDITISYSGSTAVKVNLNEGQASRIGNPVYAHTSSDAFAYQVDNVYIANGTVIRHYVGAGAAHQTLVCNAAGTEVDLTQSTGRNQITAGPGADVIHGGQGHDAVMLEGFAVDHDLVFASNQWRLTSKRHLSVDSLTSVETLQFSDRLVIIETATHGSYAELPTELYQFFITAFDAAPGVTYMDQLAEAWRYGLSVKQIVDIFTTKPQFTSVYAPTLSTKDLATALINHIVKDSATPAYKAEAIQDIQNAMAIGWTVGDVIYQVFGNLAHKPLTDVAWGNTAQQFNNEIAVAKYYTEVLNQSTTDLETLRDVMQPITASTDVSTDTAMAQLIGVALMTGGLH